MRCSHLWPNLHRYAPYLHSTQSSKRRFTWHPHPVSTYPTAWCSSLTRRSQPQCFCPISRQCHFHHSALCRQFYHGLGEIAYILGIQVKHDHDASRIELSQHRQIEDILECFRKTDIWTISTPALANEHLHKLETPEIDVKSYQQAVGALMYPMLGT